jgi:hypothetical protein
MMLGEERNVRASGDGEEYDLRPADVRLYNLDLSRDSTVVAWRLECLEAAGIATLDATVMALRRDVDVHEATRLAKAGATSAQVRDILT